MPSVSAINFAIGKVQHVRTNKSGAVSFGNIKNPKSFSKSINNTKSEEFIKTTKNKLGQIIRQVKNGLTVKYKYTEDGRLKEKTIEKQGLFWLVGKKNIDTTIEKYDINTGKVKQISEFILNGQYAKSVTNFDVINGNKVKKFEYNDNKLFSITDFDSKSGNALKETYLRSDEKSIDRIFERSPKTGKITREMVYDFYGKYVKEIFDYSKDERKIKSTVFRDGGKIIESITTFKPIDGYVASLHGPNTYEKPIKKISFANDGKTVFSITKYSPKTEKLYKTYEMAENGITVKRILDVDKRDGVLKEKVKIITLDSDGKTPLSSTQKIIGKNDVNTYYKKDGKTISYIQEIDKESQKIVKEKIFGADKILVNEYDIKTGNKIKETILAKDGKTIGEVTKFNPQTALKVKTIIYQQDGKIKKELLEYTKSGKLSVKTLFKDDGVTPKAMIEYNLKTGKPAKEVVYMHDGKRIKSINKI